MSSPQLDQVKSVEENVTVMPAVADMIERCGAVIATGHHLAVDNAGLRRQTGERLDDRRETACEVIAGPAIQLHFCAVFAKR